MQASKKIIWLSTSVQEIRFAPKYGIKATNIYGTAMSIVEWFIKCVEKVSRVKKKEKKFLFSF